jgi:hypothetical protein
LTSSFRFVNAGDIANVTGADSRSASRALLSSAGMRPEVTRYSVSPEHPDERETDEQRTVTVGGLFAERLHFDLDAVLPQVSNARRHVVR